MSVRRWNLITIYSLMVWGSSEALNARLRGSVELPCVLQLQQYRTEELLIYWQRNLEGKVVLVAGVVNGKLETDTQHKKYRGRASLYPSRVRNGDFTLHLSDLLLEDSGTYDCIVFRDTSSVQNLQNNTAVLHVTGEYSTPVVTRVTSEAWTPELTLSCNTQGGTPQPEIRWMNASDGTPIHRGHIQNRTYRDKEDFINVTSTITINVTSTTKFSCVTLTASRNLTSNFYLLEVLDTNTEKQEGVAPAVRNSLIILAVIIIVVLVGIVVLKRKFFLSTGCSRRVAYQQRRSEIMTEKI